MKYIIISAVLAVGLLGAGTAFAAKKARITEPWMEVSGAYRLHSVYRIPDTENNTVCYLVDSVANGVPAISCVKVK